MSGALPISAWRRVPVVVTVLLACAGGGALVWLDSEAVLWRLLRFPDISITEHGLQLDGAAWRLLTPMFLHFGALHLAFNGLALWILGAPIEILRGGWRLAILLTIGGLAANSAQYLAAESTLFGGLSGAIFCLCGYLLTWNALMKTRRIPVPAGLLGLMLIWLVLGFSGILDWVVGGRIANMAHLGGLLAGLLIGPADVGLYRLGLTGARR